MPTAAKKPKPSNLHPRYEPATLEDAFFAAEGLTDDREQQISIAAELMNATPAEIRGKAEAFYKASQKRVIVETGARRAGAVVVEMKAPRRVVVIPKRTIGVIRG